MDVEPPKPKQDFATLLWNTSTKVFIDHQDNYLRGFTPSNFNKKPIIRDIKFALQNGKPIGEPSAMGFNTLVTADSGKKYVVKTMILCPDDIDTESVFKRQLCNESRMGDVIFRVPNSYENKQILLTPNYFSESLIAMLLSSPKVALHTPSFPKIYGFQYDEEDPNKKIYTVMEPLQPIIPLLQEEADLLYFSFQAAAGLNTMQKLGRGTHYDFHSGNCLSRPKDDGIVRVYELNNGNYLYTQFEYDMVIIDFGMSRMETKEEIIIPKISFPAPELCKDVTMKQLQSHAKNNGVQGYQNMTKEQLCAHFNIRLHGDKNLPDAFNFYDFNPYYDLFTIIYFVMYLNNKIPLAGSDRLSIMRDKLMSTLLGIKNDTDTINQHILDLQVNYWRPDPSTFGDKGSGLSPMDPENFMSAVAAIIDKITRNNNPDIDSFNPHLLSQVLYNQKLLVLNKLIDIKGPTIKSVIIHPLIPKEKAMSTIYYQTKLRDSANMDYIKIYTQQEIISNGSQYIHVAVIDQKGISNGYKFRLDCCRVNIRDYFRTDKIESGVAINAGFFQLRTDFSPVGYYRTPDMLSKKPVPEMYRNYYGMVGVHKNGMLGFMRSVSEGDAAILTQVVTVGPVLVWEGNIIMTPDVMNEVDDNIAKFHCTQPPANTNPNDNYFTAINGVNVPNCNKISPGELSHASQPNPRSAIAMDKDNNVYFIYIEGRRQRGVGVSMAELATVCKNLDAVYAINLDGGGSSQLVWRTPGDTVIGQTNPDHDFEYPVGNIISFVKDA